MGLLRTAYSGKRVFLTGHTGFKGAWMAEWLTRLGAQVHGWALDPATRPSLFDDLGLSPRLTDERADICEAKRIREAVLDLRPDIVFHLAAQPLVRESYRDPLETFRVNVQGTATILDALRALEADGGTSSGDHCAAVMVTTDKCYENREWVYGYREEDRLGGRDPYSASKAAAELTISTFRQSFFPNPADGLVSVSSARSGNVIGGGDWAEDRIVPDAMRALGAGDTIDVRNPAATRPWQHVVEPLWGYLMLAARQRGAAERRDSEQLNRLSSAFNFGPRLTSNRTVGQLVEQILISRPGEWRTEANPRAPHEASLLNLVWDKAYHLLGWTPTWDFETTVARTVRWYCDAESGASPRALIGDDINAFEAAVEHPGGEG